MFSFASVFLTLVLGFAICSVSISAQKAPEGASADIDQCRNGAAGSPVPCTGGAWVNGNVGPSQSHWVENEFAPYRIKMIDLVIGNTYTVTVGYDILKSGKHAVDYLGTFNATDPLTNPCSGVAGCVLGTPTSTIAVPLDNVTVRNQPNPNLAGGCPVVGGPGCVAQAPGNFTMWGGTLTNAVYVPYVVGSDHRAITVTFTATADNPVLAWSGHLAWVGDWGAGQSAGNVSGSPYHGSMDACSFGCGSQDRSMSVAAGAVSGAVFIKKVVNTLDCRGEAVFAWPFTASANFGPTSFTLVDNIPNPNLSCLDAPTPSNPQASQTITSFGAGNTITVSENPAPPPPAGWTFANVNCVESGVQDSTQNSITPTASIIVQIGEVVTCTFTNTQFAPTAARVSVSGRVATFYGAAVTRARVMMTDPEGNVRTALTNNFGYYRFEDVEVGNTYVFNVVSKQYQFSPRVVTLDDAMADLDFIAF